MEMLQLLVWTQAEEASQPVDSLVVQLRSAALSLEGALAAFECDFDRWTEYTKLGPDTDRGLLKIDWGGPPEGWRPRPPRHAQICYISNMTSGCPDFLDIPQKKHQARVTVVFGVLARS